MNDSAEIRVRSTTRVERLTRRSLSIRFDGSVVSVEVAPVVLDEIEEDLTTQRE